MRRANLIMCLREVLATSHNHQISTQRYKAEQKENIPIGKIIGDM